METQTNEARTIPEDAIELLNLHWRPIRGQEWTDPTPLEIGDHWLAWTILLSKESTNFATDLRARTLDPATAAIGDGAPENKRVAKRNEEREARRVARNEVEKNGVRCVN